MEMLVPYFAENGLGNFLILTVVLGGAAAYTSGRAVALTWRPFWQLLFYMVLLGGVMRFFHWSLLNGVLLSAYYYSVNLLVLLLFAFIGYQYTRAGQISTHYSWLYKRTTPFTWREK